MSLPFDTFLQNKSLNILFFKTLPADLITLPGLHLILHLGQFYNDSIWKGLFWCNVCVCVWENSNSEHKYF